MKTLKIQFLVNWFKRNFYGVVIEVGKVNRVGFNSCEDWYIDRVKYRFGKPIDVRRYWNDKEYEKDKSFNKKRVIVKGFRK